jgi:flagellar hook assembly protein FlgD
MIQDGYYLSYQSYVPYDQRIRLLDIEAQVTSLPDSNVIFSPVKLFSTGNNAFYAVTSGNQVHIYRLVEPSTVSQETQVPPAGLTLSTGPNPFRDAVSFFVSTKKQGWINLSVYDIRGRLLRRFEPIPAKDGSASLEWDGCDSSGKRAAAGIYLLKAEQDGHSAVSKVIRLN